MEVYEITSWHLTLVVYTGKRMLIKDKGQKDKLGPMVSLD